ncbi:MAG: putative metal-binding motif-containing protein [Desulfobacterota bacterium]|nr:putative metal-binding motif-containing protein [Thermodesulfobacteriota bacterium]
MKKLVLVVISCALLFGATAAHALVPVQGDITSDTVWGQDILLRGPVFVRSGATLTIKPGVKIYGEKNTVGTLVVERGGKLNAIGTPDKPIVFTSDQDNPKRGDWGGLILNGYATINRSGGIGEGEGDTGKFGCTGSECNDQDSSGTIQYVRVEYSGVQFTPDNELNGIAFQGTGSGTVVDHVQAYMTKDDCLEWFGGTTNIKYAIATGCGDDSFDWTDGWRGKAQFVVVQQRGDEADNGIEADNLDKANDNLPRSNPTIYNMTIIGDPTTYGSESTHGLTLRRGTAGTLKNLIVMGFKKSGIRVNNEATFKQIDAGALVVDNSIFYNNNPNWDTATCDKGKTGECTYTYPYSVETFMTQMMKNNRVEDPKLGNPYDLAKPDFRPAAGSPALTGYATPPNDGFFEPVDFIGGVDPDNDWTRAPWTTYDEASWSKPTCTDSDGDGYYAEGGNCGQKDCNDNNNAVNPGAEETCDDSIDNNCNGQTDEGCSGEEPTEPCVTESLLGHDATGLGILRAFRDKVLSASATGTLYTQLYYRFTDEAKAIIMADERLRADAQTVIMRIIPIAEAAVAGGKAEIDEQLAQDMIRLLEGIQTKASLGLKIALFKAKMDIIRGQYPF